LEAFEAALKKHGIALVKHMTERAEHATVIAKELPADCECIVVWGGDGTLQETVQGLMNRADDLRQRAPIALVPAGSGNGLAESLGLRKSKSLTQNALATAAAIVEGKSHAYDLACLSFPEDPALPPVYSALVMSWGNTTALFLHADQLRARFGIGQSRYTISVLYRLLVRNYPRRPRTRLTVDDMYDVELPASWLERDVFPNEITIANTAMLKGLQMSPLAQADDGKFECSMAPYFRSKASLRQATVLAVNKQHITGATSEFQTPVYFRFSKLRVELFEGVQPIRPTDTFFASDGTLLTKGFPIEIVWCVLALAATSHNPDQRQPTPTACRARSASSWGASDDTRRARQKA
jgi:diacylglycerol kinase family enzyme